MERRKVGNRNTRTENKTSTSNRRTLRRRIVNRRNRTLGNRRNRLERVEGELRNNQRNNRFRRFYQRRRRNTLRRIFVGGLPRFVNNRQLYNLFRNEGRILSYRISYDRFGYSRGWGEIEFLNPRDAWRSIRKWNNTTYRGSLIRVEYKRRQRRRNNNYGNRGFRGGFRRGYGYRNYY